MAGTDGQDVVVVELPTVDLTEGAGGSVFVVQCAGVGVGAEVATWVDFCRVVAPARSKRPTIIRAAMSVNSPLALMPLTVRVLDVAAAAEHRVSQREVAPELVIA